MATLTLRVIPSFLVGDTATVQTVRQAGPRLYVYEYLDLPAEDLLTPSGYRSLARRPDPNQAPSSGGSAPEPVSRPNNPTTTTIPH